MKKTLAQLRKLNYSHFMKKEIQQMNALTRALAKVGVDSLAGLQHTLDEVTKRHTGFKFFVEMVHAPGGYFPSLPQAPSGRYPKAELVYMSSGHKISRELFYAQLDFLAMAYDMAQEARGDARRAFRS